MGFYKITTCVLSVSLLFVRRWENLKEGVECRADRDNCFAPLRKYSFKLAIFDFDSRGKLNSIYLKRTYRHKDGRELTESKCHY